ncbi:MAG: hypothetical protein H6742_10265 [Alphaproteobacteria bacterium]|nr:hypothetical protein [Alphaproteobacteria bacterium]
MTGLLLALTLASPAHAWTDLGEKNGCAFSKQEEGDIVAMRAQCTWDLPADKVIAWMGDWNKHGELFGSVASSKVLGSLQGGKGKVMQVHQASGISDREVVMDVDREDIPGGIRITHSKSADQSALSGERVEVGRDDGLWEIVSTADGGCTVLYELRYDPAGKVPGFMVKWFQGSGFKTMLDELKAKASS